MSRFFRGSHYYRLPHQTLICIYLFPRYVPHALCNSSEDRKDTFYSLPLSKPIASGMWFGRLLQVKILWLSCSEVKLIMLCLFLLLGC